MKVHLHGSKILREVSKPIKENSEGIQQTIDEMLNLLTNSSGIGLAAPQIGKNCRLIVVKLKSDERELVCINPEVVWSSDETNDYMEGCLSIPDIHVMVTRPKKIRLKYLDRDFNEQTEEFDSIWATVIQHEIDHLDGKEIIDYLSESDLMKIELQLAMIKSGLVQTKYPTIRPK